MVLLLEERVDIGGTHSHGHAALRTARSDCSARGCEQGSPKWAPLLATLSAPVESPIVWPAEQRAELLRGSPVNHPPAPCLRSKSLVFVGRMSLESCFLACRCYGGSLSTFSFLFSFFIFHFISFHFISFHFISFHFISFHFISFHFISFHFISFHFISFHFISVAGQHASKPAFATPQLVVVSGEALCAVGALPKADHKRRCCGRRRRARPRSTLSGCSWRRS